MHADRLSKRRKTRHIHTLHQREPALINLPIPDNVPIVGPLLNGLNPLIGAEPSDGPWEPLIDITALLPHATTSTAKTQPAAAPTTAQPTRQATTTQPASAPQTTPGSGSGSSSGGSGGSSGSGSSGSGGSNLDQSGSGSGGSNNNQSGSGSGGSNNNQSGGGGSNASPAGAAASSQLTSSPTGDASGSGSTTAETETPTVISITLANGSVAVEHTQAAIANAGDAAPSGTSGSGGGADTQSPSATDVPGGVGTTGGSTGSGRTGSSGTGKGGSGGGGSGSGDGDDGTGDGSSGNGSASASGHHGLSTGVIAAIAVVASLVFLLFLFFLCRRRAIRRRVASRNLWSRTKQPTSMYGGISSSDYFRRPPSARSSFGTTVEFDPFRQPSPVPPIPLDCENSLPSASETHSEMTQSSSGTISFPPLATTVFTPASPTVRNVSERNSVESLISLGSADGNMLFQPQTLTYNPPPPIQDGNHSPNEPPLTPMSVRPFSPTERWSFPMPPEMQNTPRNSGQLLIQSSPAVSLTAIVQHPPPRTTSVSPISADTTEFYTAVEDSPTSEDPFSDFTSSSEDHTTTTTTTTTEESFITASTAATIERVHRSFTPTLPDELEVRPGDSVRVLKQFDDGWAYALNVGTGQRGLFPVDCLRSAEVDLSTFLAAKRLSSYAGLVTPLEPVMLHR